MNSGQARTAVASQTVSLGMAALGVVVLGTALSYDTSWRVLWYGLPAMAAAVGLTLLFHRWRDFLRWRSALKSTIRTLQDTHDDELQRLTRERATAIMENKSQALDYRAKAIRSAQISIWIADIPAERITFEGVHVGSRDFIAETRVYEGRAWLDRLHPQEADQVAHRFQEFVKQRTPTFEMEYRAPDDRGGWLWILSRGLIIENDGRGYSRIAAGTHTDIHQRKLAQIAHTQERTLFNTGPVVLFRFGLEGERVIDFVSANAAHLWGFDSNWSVVGRAASALLHPDDLPLVRGAVDEALRHGQPGTDCQFRILRGDGSYHWHSMRVLFETEGERRYARGYLLDIDERKALEATAQRHNRDLTELAQALSLAQADSVVLQETSDLLNSAEDVNEAFEIVRRAAGAVFPGWSGALSAVRPQGGLSLVGQWGTPPEQDTEFDTKDCWGLRRGKPHGYVSEQRQLRCGHVRAGPGDVLRPYVCVPMSANGETVGALHLFADIQVAEADVLDVEGRAERFAETLKLAMSNLRLRAWLRDQATRDGLTGLYNRRLLDERLPIEIKRSQREQLPASLAMIDVDHFKRFNDEFGHDAGDHVLKAIGELLSDRVRVYDLACRYGGEELVLLMPSCLIEDAALKLEAIRQDIANLQLTVHGRALPPVTVSIGLAHTLGGTPESLLRKADEALYAAKRQGRNRLICHTAHLPPTAELH